MADQCPVDMGVAVPFSIHGRYSFVWKSRLNRKTKMAASNEDHHSQRDEPKLNPRVIVGVVVGGGVVAAELLWPATRTAIHDGVTTLLGVILSARRRH
jgi:hypothetical protein